MVDCYVAMPYNISILRKAVCLWINYIGLQMMKGIILSKIFTSSGDDRSATFKDFYGTEQEASLFAEEQARILGEDITINCDSDIVGFAYA